MLGIKLWKLLNKCIPYSSKVFISRLARKAHITSSKKDVVIQSQMNDKFETINDKILVRSSTVKILLKQTNKYL